LVLSVVALFILAGLNAGGYSVGLAVENGIRSTVNILAAYLAGTVIGPVLLPWLPGRSFSFKGGLVGVVVALGLMLLKLTGGWLETIGWIFLVVVFASFGTMNFTGASTYTSLSGVKKEMRIAVPLQAVGALLGVIMWLASRFI
jgi:acetyl-CoA decarbonylase/synthase complex subunit gamma